ncbi:hypothetical protein SEVIR_1G163201v4 [Setaria viridis]
MRLVRWDVARTIIDFKFDVMELILDYFNTSLDPHRQMEKLLGMLHGEDERSHEMLKLWFAGLLALMWMVTSQSMRRRLSCCCRRPVAGDDNSDEDEEDDRGEEVLQATTDDAG